MARWIHEFRSVGERALTDEERNVLRRRALRLRLRWGLLGALAITVILTGLLGGIGIAASGNPLGWIGGIALAVVGSYLVSWASDAERLALLHRRVLRLGTVEEFRRVRGDETTRRMWGTVNVGPSDEGEEDEHIRMPMGEYWQVDERFEEALARSAGKLVETFTAVGRDGAVLWVEGLPIHKLLEPPVWEVPE